jgi:hypothetical protein
MADARMPEEEYAAYKPYLDELLALYHQQIQRHPDPKVLEAAWRVCYMSVLTDIIRGFRLLPDQIEDYLSRICGQLIEDTKANIRDWDTKGPGR